MSYNYFEERFGKNYVTYEGERLLVVNPSIFKNYIHLFERVSNPKKANVMIIRNGMPRMLRMKINITLKQILETQKNTMLKDYIIERKLGFLLDMTIQECMTCSECFDKRDPMSIFHLVLYDNHLM